MSKHTVAECAYAAGIVDGEGSISVLSVRKTNGNVFVGCKVAVSSTDEILVLWLHERFGGPVPRLYKQPARCKPNYQWNIQGRTALPFLQAILPYLTIKKARALLAIEFLEDLSPGPGSDLSPHLRPRRDEIVEQMRQLNQRGCHVD